MYCSIFLFIFLFFPYFYCPYKKKVLRLKLERGIILSTDIRSYISYKIVGATPGFIQYLQGILATGKDLVMILVKSMFRPHAFSKFWKILNVYVGAKFTLNWLKKHSDNYNPRPRQLWSINTVGIKNKITINGNAMHGWENNENKYGGIKSQITGYQFILIQGTGG